MNTRQAVVSATIERHLQRVDVHYRELHKEYVAWRERGDCRRAMRVDLPCGHITGHMGLMHMHVDVGSRSLQAELKRLAIAATKDGYVPLLRGSELIIIDTKMARQLADAGMRLPLPADVRELARRHNYKWVAFWIGFQVSGTGGIVALMIEPRVAVALIAVFIWLITYREADATHIPGAW